VVDQEQEIHTQVEEELQYLELLLLVILQDQEEQEQM
jgi:hypothetical protein